MNACVYDKTEKGREEIATRKNQMPAKMRALLLMMDGRHQLSDVLKNFSAMGLNEESVNQLISEEYITLISAGPAVAPAATPVAATRPAASAKARMAARRTAPGSSADGAGTPSQLLDELLAESEDDAQHGTQIHTAAAPAMPVPVAPTAQAAATPVDEAEQFRTLYAFYNETIKSTIGFRGVMLQLKVEKCANIDDFRALRTTYLEAVLKAKGRQMTMSLRERLDFLLGGKPAQDEFVLPAH